MELTSYVVNFLKLHLYLSFEAFNKFAKRLLIHVTVVCLHTICCGLLHLPRFSHQLIWIKYFFSTFFFYVSFISITISQCQCWAVSTNYCVYMRIIIINLLWWLFCFTFFFVFSLFWLSSNWLKVMPIVFCFSILIFLFKY